MYPMQFSDELYIFLPMTIAPAFAALTLTGILDGRNGLRDLFSRLGCWRVGADWYAVLLMFPTLILAVLLTLATLIFPEFAPIFFPAGILIGLFTGLFEEIGWIGYALANLQFKRSALPTGILLGVIHVLWHIMPDYPGACSARRTYWLPHFLTMMVVAMTAMLDPTSLSPASSTLWYAIYGVVLMPAATLTLHRHHPRRCACRRKESLYGDDNDNKDGAPRGAQMVAAGLTQLRYRWPDVGVAMDVLGSLRYDGYSYVDHTISELGAEAAPTQAFMTVFRGIPYFVLMIAFGLGIWITAGGRRAQRITAAVLIGEVVWGFVGGLAFPMATREVIAAGQDTLRNQMHAWYGIGMPVFFMLAIGFGSRLFGKPFRYFSYATILIMFVFGLLVGSQTSALTANQPTPWLGVEERLNAYASMLWFAVLAIGLLRAQDATTPRQQEKPTVTPRGYRGESEERRQTTHGRP